jgi:hypothetical protein
VVQGYWQAGSLFKLGEVAREVYTRDFFGFYGFQKNWVEEKMGNKR